MAKSKKYEHKTVYGGFLSLILVSSLAYYFFSRWYIIQSTNEHSFSSQKVFYTEDEMNTMDVTLGTYNNSFNFIFGLTGGDMATGDIDVLNNPYV